MRSAVGPVLATGKPEVLRRVPGAPVSGVQEEGLLPDVHSRTSAAAGEEGAETGGMDEGAGVGQAGAPAGSALRKCNLAAQSQADAQGGVSAGSGEGTDGQGQRIFGADLFQGL